jgi:hypothetical protein
MSKFYSSLIAIQPVYIDGKSEHIMYEFIDISEVDPSKIYTYITGKKVPRIKLSLKIPKISTHYIPDLKEIIQPYDILLNSITQNSEITNIPKLELPTERTIIVSLIEELAKTNRVDANTIYELFYKQTKLINQESKSSYEFLTTAHIDKLSSTVFHSKSDPKPDCCNDFPIYPEKMKNFYIAWYIRRPIRRLHYLGISKDTLVKYSYQLFNKNPLKSFEFKPAIHLFRNIVMNPYKLMLNEKILTLDEAANLWKIYHPMMTKEDVVEANLIYNTALILYKCMNEFLSKNHTVIPINVLLNYQKKLMENMLKEKISDNPVQDIKNTLVNKFSSHFITFEFNYDLCLPKIRVSDSSEIPEIKKIISTCKSKKDSTCLMLYDCHEKYKFISDYIQKVKTFNTVYNYDAIVKNEDPNIILKKFAIDKSLTHEQNSAVMLGLCNPITFIVGPAGSGKTRVIGEIINQINRIPTCKYFCLAYTGKAVAKLKTVIPKSDSIMTIDMFKTKITAHRLDISKSTEHIHIIIDEISMITTEMMYQLFYIMNSKFSNIPITYVFLGDKFQLQPILSSAGNISNGSGQFLHNISLSKSMIIYELDSIHRYSNGISKNATIIRQAITENYYPMNPHFYPHMKPYYTIQQKNKKVFSLTNDSDFKILPITNLKEHLPGYLTITEIITDYIKNDCNFKILTPKIDHVNKINKLCSKIYHNNLLQTKKNPKMALIQSSSGLCSEITTLAKYKSKEIESESNIICYTEGDPIMVIENESKNDIFNGEEYIVSKIHEDGIECVYYNKNDLSGNSDKIRKFYYKSGDVDIEPKLNITESKSNKIIEISTKYITPAYCITCHKSQGSEWDYVVIYIPARDVSIFEGDSFIDASMIYTSITRAKKSVIVIGDISYINEIINIPISFKADVLYSVIDV